MECGHVTDMSFMFHGCTTFNQDISEWYVINVKSWDNMFQNCGIESKYVTLFDFP